MEMVRQSSEMTLPSNYFECAVINTFTKLNQIPDFVHGISIGPNKTINENDVLLLSNASDFKNIENKQRNEDHEKEIKCIAKNEIDQENYSLYVAKAIMEMENLRAIEVLDNINQHAQKMTNTEKELIWKRNENLRLMKEEININNRLKRKIIEGNINEDDLIISRKFSELLKRNLEMKSNIGNKIGTDKNTKLENDEELKLKTERMNKILKIQSEYYTLYKQIMENMNNNCGNSKLWTFVFSDLKKIPEFNEKFNNIANKTKSGNVETSDIETCSMILEWMAIFTDKLNNKINQINEEEISVKEVQSKVESEEILIEEYPSDEVSENEIQIQIETEEQKISDKYICQESLNVYTKLEDNLLEITKKIDSFTKNSNLKGFIRKLKIAINTPINALSSLNSDHMRDKYYKISQLLRGNFTFPVNDIPDLPKEQYFSFEIDFLSRRFLSQGENLVPSKPEDAFVLASIIIAIWIEFPDFGSVFLAHLMKKCPYIIPAYWPQYKGLSEKDYYISRGYNYNADGSIEDQSSFLKRMTGIFMLYVAILVSLPRNNQPHPHGLQNAWKWFAAILNLEPRPDITATFLHTFLELAGYKLSYYYGIQFWKIMHLVNTEYLMKIEKITDVNFRGPVSRLKDYIEKILKDGHFVQPKGILPSNYW